MEENKKYQRRKGRPMKRRELPLKKEMLSISLTLGVGLIVLFMSHGFLSKGREMIRFSHESAMQTAAAAAYILEEREETEIYREAERDREKETEREREPTRNKIFFLIESTFQCSCHTLV